MLRTINVNYDDSFDANDSDSVASLRDRLRVELDELKAWAEAVPSDFDLHDDRLCPPVAEFLFRLGPRAPRAVKALEGNWLEVLRQAIREDQKFLKDNDRFRTWIRGHQEQAGRRDLEWLLKKAEKSGLDGSDLECLFRFRNQLWTLGPKRQVVGGHLHAIAASATWPDLKAFLLPVTRALGTQDGLFDIILQRCPDEPRLFDIRYLATAREELTGWKVQLPLKQVLDWPFSWSLQPENARRLKDIIGRAEHTTDADHILACARPADAKVDQVVDMANEFCMIAEEVGSAKKWPADVFLLLRKPLPLGDGWVSGIPLSFRRVAREWLLGNGVDQSSTCDFAVAVAWEVIADQQRWECVVEWLKGLDVVSEVVSVLASRVFTTLEFSNATPENVDLMLGRLSELLELVDSRCVGFLRTTVHWHQCRREDARDQWRRFFLSSIRSDVPPISDVAIWLMPVPEASWTTLPPLREYTQVLQKHTQELRTPKSDIESNQLVSALIVAEGSTRTGAANNGERHFAEWARWISDGRASGTTVHSLCSSLISIYSPEHSSILHHDSQIAKPVSGAGARESSWVPAALSALVVVAIILVVTLLLLTRSSNPKPDEKRLDVATENDHPNKPERTNGTPGLVEAKWDASQSRLRLVAGNGDSAELAMVKIPRDEMIWDDQTITYTLEETFISKEPFPARAAQLMQFPSQSLNQRSVAARMGWSDAMRMCDAVNDKLEKYRIDLATELQWDLANLTGKASLISMQNASLLRHAGDHTIADWVWTEFENQKTNPPSISFFTRDKWMDAREALVVYSAPDDSRYTESLPATRIVTRFGDRTSRKITLQRRQGKSTDVRAFFIVLEKVGPSPPTR